MTGFRLEHPGHGLCGLIYHAEAGPLASATLHERADGSWAICPVEYDNPPAPLTGDVQILPDLAAVEALLGIGERAEGCGVTMREIVPLSMPDVQPGMTEAGEPRFESADPRALIVDEEYQRNLSDRSVTLIRRIVAGWDWRAFKPPVCVEVGDDLHVVDGQHTAIAAATHPSIAAIPVMIVEGERREDRASAFVKHNRDRIAATAQQLHYALVAAGDEDALTVDQVCRRAGAKILRQPPGEGRFKIGETLAVATVRQLCNRRGAQGARQVVQTCVEGMMAPVSAASLKAVEEILFGEMYRGQALASDISTTIRELGPVAERDAARFAAEHSLPIWKGLVVVLFRNTKRSRGHGRRAAA